MKNNYLLSCLLLCILTGCGESVTVITGTVKFEDGTPMTGGAVVFSTEKSSFHGRIDSDGNYVMKDPAVAQGLPNGNYKVWIIEPKDNKGSGLKGNAGIIKDVGIKKDTDTEKQHVKVTPTPKIAKKLCSSWTTDLTFEVKSGCLKTFDITLQKQP